MSYSGGFCPNCDNYISAPLLPLDYYKCNSCMMSVHVDDLVIKRNHAVGMGGIPPRVFDFRKLGSAVMFDDTQATNTVTVGTYFNAYDWIIVTISTCGANQHPSTVTVDGVTLTQAATAGSQSHARTSVYYGQPLTNGYGVSVYWTGQHPHAAVVTVYVAPLLGPTPVLATASSQTFSATTSTNPGTTLSPTASNAFALHVLGVEGVGGTILTSPSEYTLSSTDHTSGPGQPIDCEQANFTNDITSSETISSSVSLAGATWNAQCVVIFGKP